tara:strand:- start:99 stop:308 length:210 start_codon:yes stop_codon:yes gene_type:complete
LFIPLIYFAATLVKISRPVNAQGLSHRNEVFTKRYEPFTAPASLRATRSPMVPSEKHTYFFGGTDENPE